MITFSVKGDWHKTSLFLEKSLDPVSRRILEKYGKKGVEALKEATPIDSGETSRSWYYKINKTDYSVSIDWYNSNVNDGIPIAILIQYGHGLQNGAYVKGTDFINPAMESIFKEIAEEAWKELTG